MTSSSSSISCPSNFLPLPPTLLLISLKAYFTPSRTLTYLHSILDPANNILPPPSLRPHFLLCLIPDFTTLYPCSQILSSSSSTSSSTNTSPPSPSLLLGAQDCHLNPHLGPSTGSIPTALLKTLNINIVELGHAERRSLYSETDEMVTSKALATVSQGMIPLICIGEKSRPPSASSSSSSSDQGSGPASQIAGLAMSEIASQILTPLRSLPASAPVILAYEPVWAIGAARPASIQHINTVVTAIRETVKMVENEGRRDPGITRVVYGGSAGPGLWSGSSQGADGQGLGEVVDGMFLGRFAHEIEGLKGVVGEVTGWVEGKLREKSGL